jgi:hypothetical protein
VVQLEFNVLYFKYHKRKGGMGTYAEEFTAAIARSQKYGLHVPNFEIEPTRCFLDSKAQNEFPYVVRDALGDLDFKDVVAQCLAIHYRMVDVIGDWLGCGVFYTIGWVDDMTPKGMFRFDDSFIEDKLATKHRGGSVNIHAWLTLPSMEIIDVSLSTSMGFFQKDPKMFGRVIARHPDELKGMAYKPMLVGDDFLRKTGLLVEQRF